MNFKFTKGKVIWSIIIGFVIALINYLRLIFQGINASPINYNQLILLLVVTSIAVYIVKSLFQKK